MRDKLHFSDALLLFPLVFLLAYGNRFLYLPSALYSDLTISHYPNLLFLRRSLLTWGQIPLWSPAILGGFPFAANPISGLWYPPGWLALVLLTPFGFNLLAGLHLAWGATGMYSLLRCQRLSRPAALLGGLAFGLLPKLFAHYGAGHLTLVYAVPWTPWLLLAQEKPRRAFQPGVVLAVIFFADVRWAAFAGVLWLAWTIAHSQLNRNPGMSRYEGVRGARHPAHPHIWEPPRQFPKS
ncbi:MAG: hypothetical protein ACE5GO_09635, partial [Anaerolineales bacterium]